MTLSFKHNDNTASRAVAARVISKYLLVLLVSIALTLPATASADTGDRIQGMTTEQLDVPRAALPDVKMRSGLLCTEDGKVLWSRHERDRRAMASITKVMTAVVVMENADMNDEVTVSAEAKHTDFSSPFLQVGQRISVYELLEAMLVRSGNDAASALAEHVGGSEEKFVEMMNSKAEELGLSRTHFVNSHGLDAKAHYSTAEDLAVLSRYAMGKEDFRKIVGQKTCTVTASSARETAENTNILIGNYVGANGVKTGWTDDAGYSVIVSAERDGVELYAVILGTSGETARFKAARDLLDWGFVHYRRQKLASKNTVVGAAPVVDYINVTVPAAVSRDASLPVFDLAGTITRSVRMVDLAAPVSAGDRVGLLTFSQGGKVIETVPLIAQSDVRAPTFLERLGISVARAWRRLRSQPLRAAASTG